MKLRLSCVALALLATAAPSAQAADESFKPFVLAAVSEQDVDTVAREVIGQLDDAGFELAGQYSPMDGTRIIVVTSEALLEAAKASERGAYGAAQRISVSATPEGTEVGFVNPVYIQHAYRMGVDLAPVQQQLREALGFERFCGAGKKKMTARKLSDYNYMMGMQQFDDPSELGEFDTYDAAVAAVEQGLVREDDGLSPVYRIDIPGVQQTLFGVGMSKTGEADEHIDETFQMNVVDFEGCRKRAYLPYEVLVDGTKVEALHMRFRMAVHFPNLAMVGSHGFMKLVPFPGAIEDALQHMLTAE
jgi:hypothetical protein